MNQAQRSHRGTGFGDAVPFHDENGTGLVKHLPILTAVSVFLRRRDECVTTRTELKEGRLVNRPEC